MSAIKVEINNKNQLQNHISGWIETVQNREYVKTGTALDAITGGLSGLCILGGGPGTGKTALAVQIAENYALRGGGVVYLSYEMGISGFITRVYQRLTGLSAKDHQRDLQTSSAGADQLKARAADMPNLIVQGLPGEGQEINAGGELETLINQLADVTGKTVLIVVDSLHYVPIGPGAMDGKRAIDTAMMKITTLQQKTGAAVLAISHQTKSEAAAAESGVMSFSGSAMIAYAADICLIIKNQKEKNKDNTETLTGFSELEVTKNRFGAAGCIELDYNRTKQIFNAKANF